MYTLQLKNGPSVTTISVDDVVYYEGPKISVAPDNNLLIVWTEDRQDGEYWFLIDCSQNPVCLLQYLSNQISLLSVIEACSLAYCFRSYIDYETVDVLKCLSPTDFGSYTLPKEGSYLGYKYCSLQPVLGSQFVEKTLPRPFYSTTTGANTGVLYATDHQQSAYFHGIYAYYAASSCGVGAGCHPGQNYTTNTLNNITLANGVSDGYERKLAA